MRNRHTITSITTLKGFEDALHGAVVAALGKLAGDAEPPVDQIQLSPVPNPELGDVAVACFAFRGKLAGLDDKQRNNPAAVAGALAEAIEVGGPIAEVRAAGPYLNLRFDMQVLTRASIGEIKRVGEQFGGGVVVDGEHIALEFSAPNTNKPQHLGHVRNNVLGESVARILKHAGHKVTRINLVNDRGIHICKSMLAYQLWGEETTPEKAGVKGDHLIGDFYVLFEKKFQEEYSQWKQTEAAGERYQEWLKTRPGMKAEASSSLGRQARELLVAWENEDPEVRALWEKLNSWVLAGFEKTYERMGVHFDRVDYESENYLLGKDIVQEGLDKGVFHKRDDGAVAFDLEEVGLDGDKVVLRSDGTSVYITQDLGTAIKRHRELGFDRMIYVVADEQNYHFQVLFGAVEALEPELKGRFEHLAYGLVFLPQGRMKTREGTVVDADDLMDEMHRVADERIREKIGREHYDGISPEERHKRAEAIGMASLKYLLLDVVPRTTIDFDPDETVNFQGRTGAYLLYNYARTRSLLRKAGDLPAFEESMLDSLGTDLEMAVVRQLRLWPEAVERAARDRDPSKVSEYLFDLSKTFATMFTDREGHSILKCEDETLRAARLHLTDAVGTVIRTGADLLGINVLEEM